ncbi:MAG TPA: biotin--[acetyl-CoA-carboxylase] ligase [Firmicutes bacterium]|nr:biotin--[acetyl-CoA-carboxylase] ligase [Bacillota bacterium]
MTTLHDPLTVDAVEGYLATRWLGRPCHSFGTVSSTMDVARRLAGGGAPVGTMVVADAQTTGRGRQGRRWSSASGLGLWVSLIFPDDIASGVLAHVLACGVAEGIERCGAEGVAVKWPNDVLVAETNTLDAASKNQPTMWPDAVVRSARKIAGILVERTGSARYSVVGIGVNVWHGMTDFPQDLADTATSVALCTGNPISRARLLAEVLGVMERRIDAVRSGISLVDEWRRRSLVLGRLVCVERGDDRLIGRAAEIQPDGSLVVTVDGDSHVVGSGSVRFLGLTE